MLIGMLILAGIVIAGCLLAGAREGLQEVHKLGHPPRNTKGLENEEEFKTENSPSIQTVCACPPLNTIRIPSRKGRLSLVII